MALGVELLVERVFAARDGLDGMMAVAPLSAMAWRRWKASPDVGKGRLKMSRRNYGYGEPVTFTALRLSEKSGNSARLNHWQFVQDT